MTQIISTILLFSMIFQATLTPNHKTDTRDTETRIIDELVETKNRELKEPRPQFFKTVFDFSPPLIVNRDITPSIVYELAPLENDGTGYLRQNLFDPNYPAPNFDLLSLSSNTSIYTDLELTTITKLKLLLNGSFSIPQTAQSFGSSFSFDLFCTISEPTAGLYNYNRLLKIKVGTVNYNSGSNEFNFLTASRTIDLSNTIVSQNFNQSEEIRLTPTQYQSLYNSQLRLAVIFGFDTSQNTALQKDFLSTVFGKMQNNYKLNLLYIGTSNQTANITAQSTIN